MRADEIAALRDELKVSLHEDPLNLGAILEKVERLSWSAERGLYSSLLWHLCNLTCEEEEARRHWEAITLRRTRLEQALGRRVGLRVAALDHFVEANRRTARPRLLELLQINRAGPAEMIDPVTGLHTRAFLDEQVARELARARRFELDLSYAHLEIDDFPRLVDEQGLTTGTVILREVAAVIGASVRTIDYAARVAGGEFGLLLTETDRLGAYFVADRIRQKAEETFLTRQIDGRGFDLTLSAGVASFPQDAAAGEALARRAADAFFTARARGRGRVAIHHPERREYIRLSVEREDLQVTLLPEGSAPSMNGGLRNISAGGVLFESETPIPLGRTVQLQCRSRREPDEVLIPGRVVRIERFEGEAGARYEIGVLFDLVIEEQLEGVTEFLERFTAAGARPEEGADGSDHPRAA